MQKIIIFNGPPRAGKDTAGRICAEIFQDLATFVKFTDPIKEEAHLSLGLNCATDAYEELKDVHLPEFLGHTPREYYIITSERLRQVRFDEIAVRMLGKVSAIDSPFIVNTDVGFDYEGEALRSYFGSENTLLIKLKREGKSYDNDCRSWVSLPGCIELELENNSIDQLRDDIMQSIENTGFMPSAARLEAPMMF